MAEQLPFEESKQENVSFPRVQGVRLRRFFTRQGEDPFAQVTWELRSSTISDDRGQKVFEQRDVEMPSFWSQMATNVVVSKYFRGEMNTPERERSVKELIGRVVRTVVKWGKAGNYFSTPEDLQAFSDELTHILLHQYAAFNSPVWFNVGIHEHPQCSACFIVSVDDTIDSLLELQTIEGKLFKFGSGTGSNLSSIRSTREKLAGGGKPSGPVSFMRGYDAWASIIKSGGKTRRAAKMQILNVSHPDVREFIRCKPTEEKKAWALIEQGYDGGFAVPGGAYDSVAFQNANLSVRASDEFMRAVVDGRTFQTKRVTDGQVCEEVDARELLREIAEATYVCGDPGLQFDDTINAWHTCPNSGRINASNPCSEYMHLDNSACNLSSLNLLKFLNEDGTFNTKAFIHCIDVMITAQDILVHNSSYPTKKIEACAHQFRQLGLGYANLGALLMSLGMPYDSDEGREIAASITALMTGQAYRQSAELAQHLGAFGGYKKNRAAMLGVVEKHRAACGTLSKKAHREISEAAVAAWDEAREIGKQHGYRNSQVTVLAPTGTISFMMDCDTTGIEPDIALIKYKKLVGGGMLKLVNNSVERALTRLGYASSCIESITRYIEEHETIEGAPGLRAEHLAIFDCAFKPARGTRSIGYQGHLKMMSAVQPFISGAISKTVNLPRETSAEEIFSVYVDAWKAGLKAVALYRDGSKRTQPLSTSTAKQASALRAIRRRLPEERQALTHKFRVGGLEGYLTVGLFEDGSPGEIFLVVAKEGSTLSGMMDAFATAVSMALQYGVPLSALVRKFSFVRFEPSGFTGNKDVPSAHSIVDYVFRWMAVKFLKPEELRDLGLKIDEELKAKTHSVETQKLQGVKPAASASATLAKNGHNDIASDLVKLFQNSEDAPPCTNCGSHLMVRQAGCYVCLNCGAQGGCG